MFDIRLLQKATKTAGRKTHLRKTKANGTQCSQEWALLDKLLAATTIDSKIIYCDDSIFHTGWLLRLLLQESVFIDRNQLSISLHAAASASCTSACNNTIFWLDDWVFSILI